MTVRPFFYFPLRMTSPIPIKTYAQMGYCAAGKRAKKMSKSKRDDTYLLQ